MTHDELIEKVMVAIAKSGIYITATVPMAEAALSVVYEALREPTPVMISAGENSEYAGGTMRAALDHANYGGLPVAFRAMLDASALRPGAK